MTEYEELGMTPEEYLNHFHEAVRQNWEEVSHVETFPPILEPEAANKAYELLKKIERRMLSWQPAEVEPYEGGTLKTYRSMIGRDGEKIFFDVQLEYDAKGDLVFCNVSLTTPMPDIGLLEEYASLRLNGTPHLYFSMNPFHEDDLARVQQDNKAAPSLIEALINRFPLEN